MRKLKFLILIMLLVLGFLITYIYFNQPTGKCDKELWKYVWNPERLNIIEDCKTVSGVIIDISSYEPDGDVHIKLKLDDQYKDLINERNIETQEGSLVVEVICYDTSIWPPAFKSCFGYENKVHLPFVGSYVTLSGSYVLDKEHGWMEIHPVTSMRVDWIKTVKYWL